MKPRGIGDARLLKVSALAAVYGGTIVGLRDVSLEVADSALVAVLGSNGAGKSTLLRAISNTLPLHKGRVRSGSVTFDGRDITHSRVDSIVASGIVQVPEGRQVFTDLTVAENLRAGAITVKNAARRKEAEERVLSIFPILAERRGQRAGLMSGGEQQMLAIGRALMTSPKLLMLDEPSLGLAPLVVDRIGEVIRNINATGTSVLLIEQNAAVALAIATDAFVLELGEVSLHGPAAEVAASPRIRDLYLGKGGGVGATAALRSTERVHLERWSA
jgi:branched-chain amino acid transport system ATP-binding protein